MVRLPITSGLIRYLLRICVPGYRGAPAGDTPLVRRALFYDAAGAEPDYAETGFG